MKTDRFLPLVLIHMQYLHLDQVQYMLIFLSLNCIFVPTENGNKKAKENMTLASWKFYLGKLSLVAHHKLLVCEDLEF